MFLIKNKSIIFGSYVFIIMAVINSCGIVNTAKELPENITDELEKSIGHIAENAGSGLLRGLSSPESLNNTELVINDLVENLNQGLKELDLNNVQVETIVDNLVLGIADALDQNSMQLSGAVNEILDQIHLEQLLVELASDDNKHAAASLVGYIFSEESGNGKAVGDMLNRAISGLDISPLTGQLNEIELDKMLSETAASISDASIAISDVGERIRIGQQKFYRDVIVIALAVLIVGSILWFLRNYFEGRRYFVNKRMEEVRKGMRTLDSQMQEEILREFQKNLKWKT